MNEAEPKTVVIDINLTRGTTVLLIVALLAVVFVGYLVQGRQETLASPAAVATTQASTGLRKYYLTPIGYLADTASTACVAGYHMASLWEIVDTSNLEYDTVLGAKRADSGQGPPSGHAGWVRTGYDANISSTAGQANCNGWTSQSGSAFGTTVGRPPLWTIGGNIAAWDAVAFECDTYGVAVWCIED